MLRVPKIQYKSRKYTKRIKINGLEYLKSIKNKTKNLKYLKGTSFDYR